MNHGDFGDETLVFLANLNEKYFKEEMFEFQFIYRFEKNTIKTRLAKKMNVLTEDEASFLSSYLVQVIRSTKRWNKRQLHMTYQDDTANYGFRIRQIGDKLDEYTTEYLVDIVKIEKQNSTA